MQRLELSYTNDPEIVRFTQTGGSSGQINLTVVTRVLGRPPTVEYAVIDFNATLSNFLSAIKSLSLFSAYTISGVRDMYDSNGTVTSDPSLAFTYTWTITVVEMRTTAHLNAVITPVYVNYLGDKSFTQTIIHPHGPLISGTFELQINGNTLALNGNTALPSSISESNLQAAFNIITGFQNVEVSLITSSSKQAYGAIWIITYYGINGLLPDIVPNAAGLRGGMTGTSPQMMSSTLRYYSSNLLFNPIDYHFLTTASDKPNVLVTVNQIPSVCTGDCRYTFLTNTPLLTSDSISGSVVTLSLTDPSSIGYTLDQVTVTIGGQPCTIINPSTSPISNFQCQLPTNSDSTPTMPAGSYVPEVSIDGVGMVPALPAVVPFDFPFRLNSLNITSGGTNGGYNLLLSGTGFPLNLQDAKVSICGVEATITSINNIQAQIIVPECVTGL